MELHYNAHVKSKIIFLFARVSLLLFCWLCNPCVEAKDSEVDYPSFSNQSYKIDLQVDTSAQYFTGRETVRFTNSTRRELDQINFHLYPNIGQEDEAFPSLSVQGVALPPFQYQLKKGESVRFALKARNSILQIKLPFKLYPGRTLELIIDFASRVPRMQREETTLLANFLEEASDALSDEQRQRDSRDIFFACDQTMLLGYFYPLLAAPETSTNNQGLAVGVGGMVSSEVAKYEVNVTTDSNVAVIGSGSLISSKIKEDKLVVQTFAGENLRGFALAFGDHFKTIRQKVGNVEVAVHHVAGDEAVGAKISQIAAGSLKSYSAAFGDYPFPQLNIVELPLPAGLGGIEFPGLVVIAQAYCVDFDSPEAARLPGMIRQQADVVKNALEFTTAQSIAYQWWGNLVGSDSQKTPFMDESLASFAATYYFESVYGKEAGEQAINRQLKSAYQVYRSLGGIDLEVAKPTKDFRSLLQFSAIVQAKGAMLFHALRKEIGDDQFFGILKQYSKKYRFRFASSNDLREEFMQAANNSNTVKFLFQRYLKEKKGDEDLGKPETMYFGSEEKPKGKKIGRVLGKIGRAAILRY